MLLWSVPFMLIVDSRNLPATVLATLLLTASLGFTYGALAPGVSLAARVAIRERDMVGLGGE